MGYSMKESPLKNKSERFADRIVKMYSYLCKHKNEFIMSKQILRSGTSIGANISEARFASSKKDFASKLTIAEKECAETLYWLGRLKNGEFITQKQFDSINSDCKEIGRILSASIKTARSPS